jgi:hypothetical protein
MSRLTLLALAAVLPFAACAETPVTPEPQPQVVMTPPSFNRSFDAALGAASDVGVEVRSADRAAGRITGTKAGVEVTISLLRQADGTLKVAFSSPGSPETNPKLGDRWISAYERRMGR